MSQKKACTFNQLVVWYRDCCNRNPNVTIRRWKLAVTWWEEPGPRPKHPNLRPHRPIFSAASHYDFHNTRNHNRKCWQCKGKKLYGSLARSLSHSPLLTLSPLQIQNNTYFLQTYPFDDGSYMRNCLTRGWGEGCFLRASFLRVFQFCKITEISRPANFDILITGGDSGFVEALIINPFSTKARKVKRGGWEGP